MISGDSSSSARGAASAEIGGRKGATSRPVIAITSLDQEQPLGRLVRTGEQPLAPAAQDRWGFRISTDHRIDSVWSQGAVHLGRTALGMRGWSDARDRTPCRWRGSYRLPHRGLLKVLGGLDLDHEFSPAHQSILARHQATVPAVPK
jgi:hypothetical protein